MLFNTLIQSQAGDQSRSRRFSREKDRRHGRVRRTGGDSFQNIAAVVVFVHFNVCKQGGFTPSASSESTPAEPPKPAWTGPARKPTSSKAMKLGGNARDVDSFVDQLESEGVKVGSVGAPVKAAGGLSKVQSLETDPISG